MTAPTGKAEDLRRRLVSGWPTGLPSPQLKQLAREAIEYAAELERRLAEASGDEHECAMMVLLNQQIRDLESEGWRRNEALNAAQARAAELEREVARLRGSLDGNGTAAQGGTTSDDGPAAGQP